MGITVLDDRETEIAGLCFVGGTLWADGRLTGRYAAPWGETGEEIMVLRGKPDASSQAMTRRCCTRTLAP